ncbi:MAG: type II toxin-antitoxin system HicB family antitoxin [Fibromonadales bacterium]|nr:type II toxin-antitoxin system HicB family antitoxin [Fibromonadales bacterium]
MYYFAKLARHNENGNDYFVVSFPDVKGAISDGSTIEEAIANGKEALEGCLEVILEKNRLIPTAKEYKGKEFYKIWIDPKIATAILAKENRGNKTISEFVEIIGTSANAYTKLEKAKLNPTISMLSRIANANGKHLKVSFVCK